MGAAAQTHEHKLAYHPVVIRKLREWSRPRFVALDISVARPYVDLGLLRCMNGQLEDFEGQIMCDQLLFKVTRKGMRIAFPEGLTVRKYKCRTCGKVTAGRRSREAGQWYPRKHGDCPGAHELAEHIFVRVTF